jgi:hypothetical protein
LGIRINRFFAVSVKKLLGFRINVTTEYGFKSERKGVASNSDKGKSAPLRFEQEACRSARE